MRKKVLPLATIFLVAFLGLAAVGPKLSVVHAAPARPAPVQLGTLLDQPEILKIDVCHATGSETNPYVIVHVSIHSVADAQDVGGHGKHEGDSWDSYVYGGVTYPGYGDMDNCNDAPIEASADVVPVCSYDPASGITTLGANIYSDNAAVTIDGGTYNSSGFLSLPSDTYSWSWTALPGYTGSGGGIVVIVDNCTPPPPGEASVTVTPFCDRSNRVAVPGVIMVINYATLFFDGGEYLEGGFLPYPPGNYTFNWAALPGYAGSGEGTVVVPDDCNNISVILKSLFVAVCKDNCGAARWETDSGATTWQNNDLQGPGLPGVLWAVVNDDCNPTPKGCVYLTYEYGESQVSSFTVLDRGREFHSFTTVGADGKTYHMFVGYTITCFDKPTVKGDECAVPLEDLTLPNGWVAHNLAHDGYAVIPDQAGTPIYPEWPCALAPSYAFTTMQSGVAVAWNMPGTVDNDWMIWLMKAGLRPWPETWPDAPKLGFWIWGKDPMKDTRAWATELKQLDEWATLALP